MYSRSKFKNSTAGSYDITIVKKLQNSNCCKYKIVRMNYVKNKGIEDLDNNIVSNKGQVNDIKLYENISRAKRTIQELSFCNDWQWFFTGTLDKNKYNREDLDKFHKDFTEFLRYFRKNNHLDKKIDFLVIPELHSDGKSWHLHGFLNNLPVEYLVKFEIGMQMSKHILDKIINGNVVYKWLAYENKFGFNDIEPINNQEAISKYVTKYISKELGSCVKTLNAHLFYHSRGLKTAEIIKKGRMDWYNFDKSIQPKIYKGDYCSILELNEEQFKNIDLVDRFYN